MKDREQILELSHRLARTENSLHMLWDMYGRLRDDWNSMFVRHSRWEPRDKEERGEPVKPEGPE